MAKEEETEYPAFIDYEGSDVTNPVDSWSATQFEEYWRKLLVKYHRSAGVPLPLKGKTWMKRLVIEFGPDLQQMMEKWVSSKPHAEAVDFGKFFYRRHMIFANLQPKDYTWD